MRGAHLRKLHCTVVTITTVVSWKERITCKFKGKKMSLK